MTGSSLTRAKGIFVITPKVFVLSIMICSHTKASMTMDTQSDILVQLRVIYGISMQGKTKKIYYFFSFSYVITM